MILIQILNWFSEREKIALETSSWSFLNLSPSKRLKDGQVWRISSYWYSLLVAKYNKSQGRFVNDKHTNWIFLIICNDNTNIHNYAYRQINLTDLYLFEKTQHIFYTKNSTNPWHLNWQDDLKLLKLP